MRCPRANEFLSGHGLILLEDAGVDKPRDALWRSPGSRRIAADHTQQQAVLSAGTGRDPFEAALYADRAGDDVRCCERYGFGTAVEFPLRFPLAVHQHEGFHRVMGMHEHAAARLGRHEGQPEAGSM